MISFVTIPPRRGNGRKPKNSSGLPVFLMDGVLELLALNGYYSMMAMVLNSSGIPLPEGAAPPLRPL